MAKKGQQTALTVQSAFKQKLQRLIPSLGRVVPQGTNAERFTRSAWMAVQKNPALLQADQPSLFRSILEAGYLGLEPSGMMGSAHLVPYYSRKKGIMVVQLIPGYRGLVDLARRGGDVVMVDADVVWEGDDFEQQRGTTSFIRHVPAAPVYDEDGKPVTREPIGAYAVATFKNGMTQHTWMWFSEIEKIRLGTRAADSVPWFEHWAEMAKKTVVRRLMKLLPLSVHAATALALEDRAESGEQYPVVKEVEDEIDTLALDGDAERVPATNAKKTMTEKARRDAQRQAKKQQADIARAKRNAAAATPEPVEPVTSNAEPPEDDDDGDDDTTASTGGGDMRDDVVGAINAVLAKKGAEATALQKVLRNACRAEKDIFDAWEETLPTSQLVDLLEAAKAMT